MNRPKFLPSPVRSKIAARVALFFQVIAIIPMVLLFMIGGPVMILALPFLLLAALANGFRIRLGASTIAQARADDKRRPVMFLRSFKLDSRLDDTDFHGLDHRLPKVLVRWLGVLLKMANTLGLQWVRRWSSGTLKARLVKAFQAIGPVIAIGDPHELLASPWAAHDFHGDDWPQAVRDHIKGASVIVILPANTPGVIGEIGMALHEADPRRVVLLFWETTDEEYELVQAMAMDAKIPLPPVQQRLNGAEMIRFDEKRNPRFVQLPRRSLLDFLYHHEAIDFEAAVRQITADVKELDFSR